jgi:hypothetical protein
MSSRVGAVLLCAALAWPARAEASEAVLLPGHALQADGARVHTLRLYLTEGDVLVAGVPSLKAHHGAVVSAPQPAGDGGFVVRYRPPRVAKPASDTLLVTPAGSAKVLPVEVALEPAGAVQLQLSVSPDPLVLGRGVTAEVHVSVRDAAGRPTRAPLRIGTSIGKLTHVEETTPGEYRALFTPPEEKFPQVAIVAAVSVADGAFAAVPLKLFARVTVNGEGEPGASMKLAIDGRDVPPEVIGANGKFAIPLVVPPGGRASAVATDKLGNQTRREIDLALPPFPRQLLAVVPPELPADGRAHAQVVAFAVDARGAPEVKRPPALSADRGTLSAPVQRGPGLFSWTYTAPPGVASGVVAFKAGPAEATLKLHPAPPFHVELVTPDEPLGAGSDKATVEVKVADEGGSPLSGAQLTATLAGGKVHSVSEKSGGRYAIALTPPRDPGRGFAALHVELAGLHAGAPRRISLHPTRAPAGRFAAEAWVDDDLGLPVAGATVALTTPEGTTRVETDRYGTARVELAPQKRFLVRAEAAALPGLEATLDVLGFADGARVVSSVRGQGVVESQSAPPGATLDAQVPLRPAAPVDLRLEVPEALKPGEPARMALRIGAEAAGPRAVMIEASGGRLELLAQSGPKPAGSTPVVVDGQAVLRFTPPREAHPGDTFVISVTDTRTRVTVFAQVRIR